MGKRPPCIVFVSIVLFSVRICPRRPELRNAPSGHAFDLIGIPPLPGSLRGALSGCDGSRRFFVPLQRSACDWTQVSLLLLLFMAFGADAPHRPTQKVVWLIGFADGRRKVKDALYYSVFKERAEAIEKAPSLSMPKS